MPMNHQYGFIMTTRNDTCDWQALHSEKFSDAKNKASKLLFHASNALKKHIIAKKVPFFLHKTAAAESNYIQKVGLLLFSFLIVLICKFVLLKRAEICHPFWESRDSWPWHKSADTELEIFVAFFFSDAWPAAGLLGCVPPLWPFCHYSAWTLSRLCFLNDFFWRPCLWLYFFFQPQHAK